MQNEKITSDGLPVITRNNLIAFIEISSNENYSKNKFNDFMDKLNQENPEIYNFFDKAIEKLIEDSSDYARGFITGSYMIYEVLRRQSAANKLEREVQHP